MKNSRKTHIGLNVSNMDKSVEFYSALLDTQPVKRKVDYAKYDLPVENLVLSLIQTGNVGNKFAHFGFLLEGTTEVVRKMEQLKTKNITVHEEMDVNCCYANQDKFWVKDPDGIEWEFYHFKADVEIEDKEAVSACCEPSCCE
jgi:catechol 2,3-dioxygenase-like lactoylglutathione lyase family enzyme